jgi:primosomal protein N' (replication factor Y)
VHNKLELNAEQTQVVAKISQQLEQFHTGLLYGITGSGKTEVFLHLIEKILQRQKQVLVLVPEINLTPQMSARFAQRFPYAEIMQLNSEVSDKQRLLTWMSAKNGSCQIVLGTRLSIFTPFANLGMIIVDEEHDDSFKQSEGLRYHARDLAVWRAKQLNIPILLASATPSLESLYNYQQGKYQLYKLTARANPDAVLPQIELINLQHFPVNHAGISNPSIDAIAECLQKKEIALVFINRRGYAPIITCYECGWVSNCRNCSSKMVYHHNIKRLRCHHCGYSEPIPTLCPICRNQYLHTIGHGTQKLEEFLQQNFPAARIRRVDRDTTSSKKSWHTLYQEINAGEVDILVGTQMLAKGHDFAKLTLVIGLNLDNALFSYDYRASEDMFNGLTQIAGRAGRAATPGKVLLQTNYSGHPLYQFLQQHDFNGFVNYTLKERHENKLPPFSYSTIIRLSSNKEKLLKEAMQQLRELLAKTPHAGIMLFPPQPAVMYKLHNKYRAQLAISAAKRNELHAYLNLAAPLIAAQIKKVTIAIDVDPIEI